MEYFPHAFGYRLMGPSIVYFLQWLTDQPEVPNIVGPGSSLIRTIIEQNQDYWPWLTDISLEESPHGSVSVLPGNPDAMPVFPDPGKEGLISLADHSFAIIVEPAFSLLAKSVFEGSDAHRIQSGIRQFVRDYAMITRGLNIPVPKEPILEHWSHCILSPMDEFLEWAASDDHVPGFTGSSSPGRLVGELKHGHWPTGNLRSSGVVSRWWAGMFAARRKNLVLEAAEFVSEEN